MLVRSASLPYRSRCSSGETTPASRSSKVLKTRWGDDLQDVPDGVARIPEGVPLIARFEHEVARAGLGHVLAELCS